MGVKRYIAKYDTTITNAYKENLMTRGTGSNMGEAESLEVFSIYAQAATSSATYQGDAKNRERARILVQFPAIDATGPDGIVSIKTDRDNGVIPAAGSVNYFLNLYNARHTKTLPESFTLVINTVKQSWEEGFGVDMEEYLDVTHNVEGANWIKRAANTSWHSAGASTENTDYHTGSDYTKTFTFTTGLEDMSVDITDIVEKWLASSNAFTNYGLRVSLTQSQEESTSRSYYTKKFYARHSSFFFLRPNIEARWDDSKKDDSANFYASSSLASAADNLNTVYLYNRVRGQLSDVAALGGSQSSSTKLHLKVYSALGGTAKTLPAGGGVASANDNTVTGSWVETGIYSASFAFTGSETTIYPVWAKTDGTELHTGSAITVKSHSASNNNVETEYVTTVTNLKSSYTQDETARLRLFIRDKNWSPTIYTKATAALDSTIVPSAYWKLFRVKDDFVIFDYGTGSINHTKLSYDVSGSYFDFNMSMLEKGYAYGLKFIYKINGNYHEQPETFKFRVD